MTNDLKARLDAMGQAIFRQHDDPAKETPEVWRDIFEAVALDLLSRVDAAEAIRSFCQTCPNCGAASDKGDFPPMDEDGCCTLCGADCHIEGLAIFAEEQEARADAAEAQVKALTAERDVYHEICTLREVRLTKERNELIRFICHYGGLANEWAKQCPFGTKLTEHIRGELNRWLKAEARALKEDRDAE